MWPELKIVHVRHSKSQGSVETANQDMKGCFVTTTATSLIFFVTFNRFQKRQNFKLRFPNYSKLKKYRKLEQFQIRVAGEKSEISFFARRVCGKIQQIAFVFIYS